MSKIARMNITNSGAGQTTTFDGDGFSGMMTSTHSGYQESHTDLGSERIDRYGSSISVGENMITEVGGNKCDVISGDLHETRAMGDVFTVIGDTRELTGNIQADYDRAKADLVAQRSVFPDSRLDPPSALDMLQELLATPKELTSVFTVTPDPEDEYPLEIPEGTSMIADISNLAVKVAYDYEVAITKTMPKRLMLMAQDKVEKAKMIYEKATDFGIESTIDKILGGDDSAILVPTDKRDLSDEIDLEEYKNSLINTTDSLGNNTLDRLLNIPIG